ncbi:hypothetical protein P152DRAFT_499703 [Eremomyces bilateralis CBS 781.70]|uniref:NADP-dependent oxidoreductase domain-containing protein n=1 Tax=Eremomyces bilateralis CBS 781.70 TaxID=1392243 RepID=A0A6G1G864_9PEZI|nr:uncharacterized protein P152DRAFT_499703 [Eremomyces bilateralis CBS 781.70]KAF1814126.1 hypothetical protein P152DRAFT_499703 [Eremomyces bilateralis CBS 781.70]
MSYFAPAPPPKTALGHHRLLSPNASIRVSPLCLGAMNFGNAWYVPVGRSQCWGRRAQLIYKDTSFEILDYFWESGGNFIATASSYQFGESETWIGEWMKARANRDEMVIATGFPNSMLFGAEYSINKSTGGIFLSKLGGPVDTVPQNGPIKPHKL